MLGFFSAQKGRNDGKGVLVKPSAHLIRLCTLQVCPVEVAGGAAAFAYLDVEIGAAVVAAAFGYHFVKTTVCCFTPGAHLSSVELFGTFAAALSFGCNMNTSAAMAAATAAASGYLFVETTACGFSLGAQISLVERFVTVAAAFCFVFNKVVAAATQSAASWAAAFVGSLAIVACHVVTLSGILVFVVSVFAGFCWAIARVSRRRSLEPCASGHVLGLRLLGSCYITLMSHRCVHDDASEDAQAFDEVHPGAVDKLSSGGELSSAAAALNYDVVPVDRNSVLDDGWEVGHHTASSLTAQQLRQVPQCASLPSTQRTRFWAREVCTMCRTSLSS